MFIFIYFVGFVISNVVVYIRYKNINILYVSGIDIDRKIKRRRRDRLLFDLVWYFMVFIVDNLKGWW